MMLAALDRRCEKSDLRWTLQAIVTKVDSIKHRDDLFEAVWRMKRDIMEEAPTCLPLLLTSARKHPHPGVDQVRASIVEACGLGHTEVKVVRDG